MAEKQKPTTPPKNGDANPIVTAAKALGKAAGTVASTFGVHGDAASHPPSKSSAPAAATSLGKLSKKNKQRLPRKEKKALKRGQKAEQA